MTLDIFREPFVELLMAIKERRHDKVEQRPQLRIYTKKSKWVSEAFRKAVFHTSFIVFWIGVPVSSKRLRHGSRARDANRWLLLGG
jgi:hypothetical protein